MNLRAIVKEIGSKISNPDTQFESDQQLSLKHNYGIKLPYGIKTCINRKIWRCCKLPTNNGKSNKFHYKKKDI